MGSRISKIYEYKGVVIYDSANTHPAAKTKSVFAFIGGKMTERCRYQVESFTSFHDAVNKLKRIIDATERTDNVDSSL